MKKVLTFRKTLMILLVLAVLFAGSVSVFAYSKSVTKSPIKHTFVLSYDSYRDSEGRKLVKNARGADVIITNVGTKPIAIISISYSIALLDGGRDYNMADTVKYRNSAGATYTNSAYVDFCYVG